VQTPLPCIRKIILGFQRLVNRKLHRIENDGLLDNWTIVRAVPIATNRYVVHEHAYVVKLNLSHEQFLPVTVVTLPILSHADKWNSLHHSPLVIAPILLDVIKADMLSLCYYVLYRLCKRINRLSFPVYFAGFCNIRIILIVC